MQVQVHTDNHIQGSEALIDRVTTEVEGTFGRFAPQITRVEVHLNDTNAHKGGDNDKRCLMEARLAGHQPVAASCEAATLDEAINGAADRLEKSLDHILGKLGNKKGRTSFGGDQVI